MYIQELSTDLSSDIIGNILYISLVSCVCVFLQKDRRFLNQLCILCIIAFQLNLLNEAMPKRKDFEF